MKICPCCLHNFYHDRERVDCHYCRKVFNRDEINRRMRRYYAKNHEYFLIMGRKYRLKNHDKNIEASRKRRANRTPEQKEKERIYRRLYHIKNKNRDREMARLRMNKKLHTDEVFRIHAVCSGQLRRVLKQQGKTKSRTLKKYGIDARKIFERIGPRPMVEYELDHIIPITAFDLSDTEQVKLAFAPENFQWMKKIENIKKSNVWIDNNGMLRKGTKYIKE